MPSTIELSCVTSASSEEHRKPRTRPKNLKPPRSNVQLRGYMAMLIVPSATATPGGWDATSPVPSSALASTTGLKSHLPRSAAQPLCGLNRGTNIERFGVLPPGHGGRGKKGANRIIEGCTRRSHWRRQRPTWRRTCPSTTRTTPNSSGTSRRKATRKW